MFAENDVIRSTQRLKGADVGGNNKEIDVPPGTTGTVVAVYNGEYGVEAYEIEFYIQERDLYVLATVPASNIIAEIPVNG